jgi:hypothetical protein
MTRRVSANELRVPADAQLIRRRRAHALIRSTSGRTRGSTAANARRSRVCAAATRLSSDMSAARPERRSHTRTTGTRAPSTAKAGRPCWKRSDFASERRAAERLRSVPTEQLLAVQREWAAVSLPNRFGQTVTYSRSVKGNMLCSLSFDSRSLKRITADVPQQYGEVKIAVSTAKTTR